MLSYRTIFIAFLTIVTRETQRFMRIWVQTIVPSAITATLYFVIFGNLIGKQISAIDGISYMNFIVPGLIMMAIINNSFSNVVSSFYGAKFARHIEELLVAPVPNIIILLGYVIGGVLRGLVVGAVVTIVTLFFTNLSIEHPVTMLFVVFLTASAFSLGGFINAVFATKFDDVSLIPTFILTPLTYFGGVFYSIKMLPELWQNLSLLNPILYMINAFRYSMFGVSDINVLWALGLLIAFNVILFIAALHLLNKGTGLRN